MKNFQTTIAFPISCCGFGLHSGKITQLTLKPARANSGIIFIRTDVKNHDNKIYVDYKSVVETDFATTIANASKISISTIEHLMAAFYGCGIDNIIAEVDGPEVPIMDGSSRPFIFMLECAGISYLAAEKRYVKILKEIHVLDGNSYVVVNPCADLKIETSINFSSKAIGQQHTICQGINDFNKNISSARTFGFVNELKYLNSKGLGLGINLQNIVGIDQNDNILTELRFNDEFVRHKVLDAIGDFYTAGNIIGYFKCNKSGHYLNNQILHKIFSNSDNYQIIT